MKPTFKCNKPVGRFRAFDSTTYDVKLKRKKFGYFFEKYGEVEGVYIAIEKDEKHDDGNPNCSWMNIRLKTKAKTVEEVKQFFSDNIDFILNNYKLHLSN